MLTIIFADETEFKVQATKSFSRKNSSESTDYRVEVGANIADHIENAPLSMDFNCIFGDAPLTREGALAKGTPGEHTDFDDKMLAAWKANELITLDSKGRDIWENMQIQDYSLSVDNSSGYGLPFTLSVKEIRFADSKKGNNFPDVAKDRPTARRFAPARSGGVRTPTPATTNQISKANTIA
jgi:hypothetical protein